MLYMYVSSVLIYGCEPWEFQKAYAWQVLIDYRDMKKNVSSKKYPIYQYPCSFKVECGGHPKYEQRKLAICSTHIIVSFKHVTKNCYENITKITGKKLLSMK